MISNYHSYDSFDNLLLFTLPDYLEEIEDTPYADGYLVQDTEYEISGLHDTAHGAYRYEEREYEGREYEEPVGELPVIDYRYTEEISVPPYHYQGSDIQDSSLARVYSFLEEMIVHLMYGYLEQDSYPERDYLVYEEIDTIRGDPVLAMWSGYLFAAR